jgi:hypothetical protein
VLSGHHGLSTSRQPCCNNRVQARRGGARDRGRTPGCDSARAVHLCQCPRGSPGATGGVEHRWGPRGTSQHRHQHLGHKQGSKGHAGNGSTRTVVLAWRCEAVSRRQASSALGPARCSSPSCMCAYLHCRRSVFVITRAWSEASAHERHLSTQCRQQRWRHTGDGGCAVPHPHSIGYQAGPRLSDEHLEAEAHTWGHHTLYASRRVGWISARVRKDAERSSGVAAGVRGGTSPQEPHGKERHAIHSHGGGPKSDQ